MDADVVPEEEPVRAERGRLEGRLTDFPFSSTKLFTIKNHVVIVGKKSVSYNGRKELTRSHLHAFFSLTR